MTTIKEIARKANVSIGTVDRVIHKRGRVSKATEEKIQRIITDLDYQPNVFARQLKRSRAYVIGIVMPGTDQDCGYWKLPERGIQKGVEELSAHQVEIRYLFFDKENPETLQSLGQKILRSRWDGLIIATASTNMVPDWIKQLPVTIPYILIDSYIPETRPVCRIVQDHFKSGTLAAKIMHFITPPATRVVVIKSESNDPLEDQKLDGFLSYMEEHFDKEIIVFEMDPARPQSEYDQWVQKTVQKYPDLSGILVLHTGAFLIADALLHIKKRPEIRLIGYECIEENIVHLRENRIHFLISQMPETQGYLGLHYLFKHIAFEENLPETMAVKLDIITKENLTGRWVDTLPSSGKLTSEGKKIPAGPVFTSVNQYPAGIREDMLIFQKTIQAECLALLNPAKPIWVGRAPARLNIMGGMAELSGTAVLETTCGIAALVGVQLRDDNQIVVHSSMGSQKNWTSPVLMQVETLFSNNASQAMDHFIKHRTKDPHCQWTAIVHGMIAALMAEGLLTEIKGCTMIIHSDIPLNTGVGSSAAVEVAALIALCGAFDISLEPEQIPKLCQKMEQRLMNKSYSVMDQSVPALGKSATLHAYRYPPFHSIESIEIPEGLQFAGIFSGVPHKALSSIYEDTYLGAQMGAQIIYDHIRTNQKADLDHLLYNITPEAWQEKFSPLIPDGISGKKFIDTYRPHFGLQNQILPGKKYYPRLCTGHAVLENARTLKILKIMRDLQKSLSENALMEAGELMIASHESHNNVFFKEPRKTDILVDLIKSFGPGKGFYGAKASDWGPGGTVTVLALKDTEAFFQKIIEAYELRTEQKAVITRGTSPGALECGVLTMKIDS